MDVTKEELRQYRSIRSEVVQLGCEIAEIESIASSPRIAEYGDAAGGGGSPGDRQAALIARVCDLRARYTERIEELLALKVRIEYAIEQLDAEEQRLVRLRYFRALTWEAVAVEMNLSWNAMHRRHRKILKKLR